MRLRSTVAVVLGTGMLVLATPAVASAATGLFTYKFTDAQGIQQIGGLVDPPSGECIDLPEVTGGNASADPAHSPDNETDATATVFAEPDCDGDVFYPMDPGKKLGEDVKLRSVIFS